MDKALKRALGRAWKKKDTKNGVKEKRKNREVGRGLKMVSFAKWLGGKGMIGFGCAAWRGIEGEPNDKEKNEKYLG